MDAKDAIKFALKHVDEVLGEQLSDRPSVEEVWRDPSNKVWRVTVSVHSRPNRAETATMPDPLLLAAMPTRKVVVISAVDGALQAIWDWPIVDAA
jgi:hypothetical protein